MLSNSLEKGTTNYYQLQPYTFMDLGWTVSHAIQSTGFNATSISRMYRKQEIMCIIITTLSVKCVIDYVEQGRPCTHVVICKCHNSDSELFPRKSKCCMLHLIHNVVQIVGKDGFIYVFTNYKILKPWKPFLFQFASYVDNNSKCIMLL